MTNNIYDIGGERLVRVGEPTNADHAATKNYVDTSPASVPPGGTTGQVLTKASDADGDADWESAGGSGGITSPIQIPDLALWLDASQLDLDDDDPVALWPDSSPNGYDAAQATGDNQPVFKAAAQNGLGVVRFNQTPDPKSLALSGAGLSLLNAADGVTVFAVFVNRSTVTTAWGENDILGMNCHGNTNRRLVCEFDSTGQVVGAYASNDDAADETINTGTLAYAPGNAAFAPGLGAFTACYCINLATGLTALGIGAPLPVTTGGSGPPNTAMDYSPGPFPNTDAAAVLIGGDNGASGTYAIDDADLCELFIIARACTPQERREAIEYLAAKWGTL